MIVLMLSMSSFRHTYLKSEQTHTTPLFAHQNNSMYSIHTPSQLPISTLTRVGHKGTLCCRYRRPEVRGAPPGQHIRIEPGLPTSCHVSTYKSTSALCHISACHSHCPLWRHRSSVQICTQLLRGASS